MGCIKNVCNTCRCTEWTSGCDIGSVCKRCGVLYCAAHKTFTWGEDNEFIKDKLDGLDTYNEDNGCEREE